MAGKRIGLVGERSGLYWEAVRIIREMQEATDYAYPGLAVIENVPGLLSSNRGEDFALALAGLVGCEVSVPPGGWGTSGVVFGPMGQAAWRVLDAQYFGLAQRRKRVFVVFDPRSESAGEILFEPESSGGHPPPRRTTGQDVTGTLGVSAQGGWGNDLDSNGAFIPLLEVGARTNGDGDRDGDGIGEPDAPMYTLQAGKQHGVATWPASVPPTLNTHFGDKMGLEDQHALHGAGLFVPAAIRTANTSANGHGIADNVAHTLDGANGQAVAFNWQNGGNEGYAFTEEATGPLDTSQTKAVYQPHTAVRRLTPRETERLQGFPDDWTLVDGMSDSARYRLMGNAVAVPVAEWIGRRIMQQEAKRE